MKIWLRKWCQLNGNCAENSYVRNSTGRGHFGASSPTTTGSKPEYGEKNIYDMAGNVTEWTMEAYDASSRVRRGGSYIVDNSPASSRSYSYPRYPGVSVGFRFALYL